MKKEAGFRRILRGIGAAGLPTAALVFVLGVLGLAPDILGFTALFAVPLLFGCLYIGATGDVPKSEPPPNPMVTASMGGRS